MRAAAYCRVSTDEQSRSGTVASQRAQIERYCLQHNISLLAVYADDGISGTIPTPQRPEASRLLSDCGRKLYDAVVVTEIDRLGRDPDGAIALQTVATLRACGVQLLCVTQPSDETPSGRLLRGMLALFSGFERSLITERTRRGKRRAAAEGRFPGGRPAYGYRVAGGRYELDDTLIPGTAWSPVEVVRELYRLQAEGYTLHRLAAWLREQGVPSPSGKPTWSAQNVRHLLTRDTYTGETTYGGEARALPAIITRAQWDACQERLRSNQVFSLRNRRHPYLLSNLLRCGVNGAPWLASCTVTTHRGKRYEYRYYTCLRRREITGEPYLPACHHHKVRADRLDAEVWQGIVSFLSDPARHLETGEAAPPQPAQDLERLRAGITRCDEERTRILRLYRRGVVSSADTERQLEEIDTEEARLRERLAQVEATQARYQAGEDREARLMDMAARMRERLRQGLTEAEKREIVLALIERIVIDAEGRAHVYFRQSF